MPKLLNYHRYENFLDTSVLSELLSYCIDNEKSFKQATIHDGSANSIDNEYRKSLVLRDLGSFRNTMINHISELLPDIYSKLQINPFEIKSFELEIAAHGDGAFFREHIDTLTGKERTGKARTISLVYYLHLEPKRFEGGELQLNPIEFIDGSDEPILLTPINNSLIVFPSFAPHEVRPIKCPGVAFSGWRFTINCWIYK